MAERGADRDLDGRREQHGQLVDHRQIGGIGHDDFQRLADAPVGNEAVAQHQVGRNRPEQLLVDVERIHVHELEPVPIRETPRLLELGTAIDLADRSELTGSA